MNSPERQPMAQYEASADLMEAVIDPRMAVLQSETESDEAKETAFASMVDEFGGQLHAYAARIAGLDQAEDVVQSSFMRAFRGAKSFEAREGEDSSLAKWLYTITRNEAFNVRRREVRHPSVPMDEEVLQGVADTKVSKIGNPVSEHDFKETLALLCQVNPRQLKALMLSAAGYTHNEIAESQETSMQAVKILVHRGRKAAREIANLS